MRSTRTAFSVLCLGGVGLLGGCDAGVEPPGPPGPPAHIEIAAGNDQVARISTRFTSQRLPEPIVARVTDAAGRPVTGLEVVFVDWGLQGKADPDTVETDSKGQAATWWTVVSSGWGVHRMGALHGSLEQGYARALVIPAAVDSLRVRPEGATLLPGDTVRLRTDAYAADGTPVWPPSIGMTNVSSNPSVISVDSTGLLTARVIGVATVTTRLAGGIPGGSATTTWEVRSTPPADCNERGGTTHGSRLTWARGDTTWTRVGSPHRVAHGAQVDGRLTIGPGALVCLGADLSPYGTSSTVRVEGSGTEPARLVSASSSYYPPTLTLREARHARFRKLTIRSDSLRADSVTVEGGAIRVSGRARLNGVTVADAPQIEAAITVYRGDLQDVVVTNPRSSGIQMNGSSTTDTLVLRRVRVEGAGYGGLCEGLCSSLYSRGSSVLVSEDLTITGGAWYPVKIPVAWMPALLAQEGAAERLRGNRADTLVVVPDGSPLLAVAGLPWLVPARSDTSLLSRVEVAPGASLTLQLDVGGTLTLPNVTLAVRGAPDAPATLRADCQLHPPIPRPPLQVVLPGAGPAASEFRLARIEGFALVSRGEHALAVAESEFLDAGLILEGRGSTLRDVRFRGSWHPTAPSVSLALPDLDVSGIQASGSPGVAVSVGAPRVKLRDCLLADSWAGVQVEKGGGATVTGCDLVRLWGFGVRNLSSLEVDATGNWWGDPTGPLGPLGTGVSGTVRFSPFLTAPRFSSPPPVGQLPTPDRAFSPTGFGFPLLSAGLR